MKKKIWLSVLAICGTLVLLIFLFFTTRLHRHREPVEITVWHYYNGDQKNKFDELVQEFNRTEGAEQNIIIESVSKGTINELTTAVNDSAAKKVGADPLPDMLTAYADVAFTLDQQGLTADISGYLSDREIQEYIPGYMNEGRFGEEGAIKIFPVAKSTEVLVLNETAWEPFAAATGASQTDLLTWEGIARTAENYHQWSGGDAFFGRDAYANYLIIGSRQLGHELFQVKNGNLKIDFDRETMHRLWDQFYLPYVKGYYTSEGRFRSDDMKTGKLVAYVGSTSGAPYTPSEVTYDDGRTEAISCRILSLPNFEGSTPMAVQQGAGMMVFSSTEEKEQAAVTFLKWFTRKEHNIAFSAGSGYLPVKVEANDRAVFDQVLEEEQIALSGPLKETLYVGLEEARTCEMYTSKPFLNATAARSVLNKTLEDQARADREEVKQRLSEGMDLEAAVASLEPEYRFQVWYDSTFQALFTGNE